MATSFSVGDKTVYPAQGVAEVVGFETLEISGCTNRFYVLRCIDSEKKIRIPVGNVEQVGLRSVLGKDEVDAVLDVLRGDCIEIREPNWNRRYRRYLEKIQSGDLGDVALVVRDLHLIKADKQLSYGERSVYETARTLIVQELAVVQDLPPQEVELQLDALLR